MQSSVLRGRRAGSSPGSDVITKHNPPLATKFAVGGDRAVPVANRKPSSYTVKGRFRPQVASCPVRLRQGQCICSCFVVCAFEAASRSSTYSRQLRRNAS
eukprot:6208188-Pleurochrysis_carterae.AAC.4